MNVARQLFNALNRLVEVDVKQKRTNGFQYLDSREVICGSEHAFRIPRGLSVRDVSLASDTLVAAVGAPVELIDRGGAVIVRVVEKDFPKKMGYEPEHVKDDRILIGYDRLMKPVYHPLNTHILVGGASGSGKTDGIRWWLYQLVQQGYEVRICDLKGFSFFPFEPLPNVTIAKSLPEARDMLVESMSELLHRKQIVIRTRNRDVIKSFRPVVMVIDEAAALAPKQNRGKFLKMAEDCDDVIAMFGQQAREPRMFMLYCTQRPSVDVINMQFRANVEAMIAFRCRDKHNSTLIIGKEGAEQISPATPGRCIYTFDRDYNLQVPYIGSDAAWEELLTPLRIEVLSSGRSQRTESPGIHLDGVVSRADRDNPAARYTEPVTGPGQTSERGTPGLGDGRSGLLAASRQGEGMVPHTRRTKTHARYSDEVD